MKIIGDFLWWWIAFIIILTTLSLLLSAFVQLHYVVGLGFLAALASLILDRWEDRRRRRAKQG